MIDAERGYVLTNDHVLGGSSQAAVVLADGRERIASQIRRDPAVDLAVLVIDPEGLNLTSGQLGRPGAAATGRLGALDRPARRLSADDLGRHLQRAAAGHGCRGAGRGWLETDAAVNSLNSGGPLINLNGEVVGINTVLAGRRGQVAGMGFAMPADRARRMAADLVEFGRVRHAFLGVQIEPAATVVARPAPFRRARS